MQLIAKCETRQSLFNFKAMAQEADAIMLSRGNLGLDVLPEKMALVQKHVIQQCNMLGKPAIVTRVVDTMVSSPRPTRYSFFPFVILQSSVVDTMVSSPRPTRYSFFSFVILQSIVILQSGVVDTMVSSPHPTRYPIFPLLLKTSPLCRLHETTRLTARMKRVERLR